MCIEEKCILILQNTLYFAKITVEMLSKYMAGLSRIVLCVKQSQKNCQDYKQLLRHACNPHYKRATTTASL